MDCDELVTETLKEEKANLVEEARMLLPGVQALFGFQTIAVFNDRFDVLPTFVKQTHLLALGLVVLAMALVIAPAAFHRIAEPGCVSRRVIRLSSQLITSALAPLSCGIALDMYVVIYLASGSEAASLGGCIGALVFLLVMWFGFPISARGRAMRLKKQTGKRC